MNEQWIEIKDQLSRLLDNEVRVFSDEELRHLEHAIREPDKEVAAAEAADLLNHSGLEGELLALFCEKIGNLISHPIQTHPVHNIPIYDISSWASNPKAKTFEIGW